MMIPDPKFKINQHVYHVTPESPRGVVLDMSYSFYARQYLYLVTFGVENSPLHYYENELSVEKTII